MGSGLCAVLEAASGSDYPRAASLASLGRVLQDLGSAPRVAVKIRQTADPGGLLTADESCSGSPTFMPCGSSLSSGLIGATSVKAGASQS